MYLLIHILCQFHQKQQLLHHLLHKKIGSIGKKLKKKPKTPNSQIGSQNHESLTPRGNRSGESLTPRGRGESSTPRGRGDSQKIGRAVQQECRDRSRMPSSA
eukprot:TRINITY_DN72054_c0_g1_i1.p1 TRINITY_DN72054_c0_g1~~TRINITY_DN72054_c0_g1_i1.p1  ORF type:complete len:109 (-),score=11.57 TRINITY_DN72054_c0_g1_i1:10-315(-)